MALFRRILVALSQNSMVVSGMRCEVKKKGIFPISFAESKRQQPDDIQPFVEVCSKISPDPEDYVIAELPIEEIVFRRITIPKAIFKSLSGKEQGALKLHIATEMGIDPSSFTAQVVSVIPAGEVNALIVVLSKTASIANHVSFLTASGLPEPDVLEVPPVKWLHTIDWPSISSSCFVITLDIDYTAIFLFHNARLLNVHISLEDNLINALGAIADVLGTDEWETIEKIRSEDPETFKTLQDVFMNLFPYNLAKHVSYLVGSTPELPSGRISDIVPVAYVVSPSSACSKALAESLKLAESFPFPGVSIEVAPSVIQPSHQDIGAFPLALRGGRDLVKGQPLPAEG